MTAGFLYLGQVLSCFLEYFPAHNILFGRCVRGFLEDTWLCDGNSWVEKHLLHHPAGRAYFATAYEEHLQIVIVFGGEALVNPPRFLNITGK